MHSAAPLHAGGAASSVRQLGTNGPTPTQRDLWELLYNLGGDRRVAAHDHLYERHAPMNSDQRRTTRGIRQFTVGTGGAPPYQRVRGGAQLRAPDLNQGVLRLKLDPALYEWEFLGVTATFWTAA